MAMLNHVALTGGRITVSLTALNMGLSTLTVGLLVAVFAILPMFASVHTGRWIDRIGVTIPLRLGTAMVCLGACLPFLFQTRVALLFAACAIGVGFLFHQVAIQNLLGRATAPADRLRNFSWLSLALAASGFAGPLVAGLSIDHLGDRFAFGVLSLCPLVSAVGLYTLRHRLASEDSRARPAPAPDRRVMDLLRQPALRRILLVNTCLSGAWDTHVFVVPIFGVSIGLSATTIGVILASFSAAAFAIRLVLPWIQRRVRSWTMVRVAMGTAAIDFMLYPFFSDVQALMGLSFVLGLALGSCQPSMLALLHLHAPAGRTAEASGLRMAMTNGSQVSLPLAFGALGAVIGVAPLFWAYAVALLVGGWLNRHPPAESGNQASRSAPHRAAEKRRRA